MNPTDSLRLLPGACTLFQAPCPTRARRARHDAAPPREAHAAARRARRPPRTRPATRTDLLHSLPAGCAADLLNTHARPRCPPTARLTSPRESSVPPGEASASPLPTLSPLPWSTISYSSRSGTFRAIPPYLFGQPLPSQPQSPMIHLPPHPRRPPRRRTRTDGPSTGPRLNTHTRLNPAQAGAYPVVTAPSPLGGGWPFISRPGETSVPLAGLPARQ